MKKNALIILCGFLIFFKSNAQNLGTMTPDFIGIGTNTPYSSVSGLSMKRNTNGFYGSYIETAASGRPFYGYTNGPSLVYTETNFGINQWRLTAGTFPDIITGNIVNGNVGIGVTTPTYPLDTRGRIRIRDSGAGESAGIWFNNNGNTALNTFIGIDLSNNFGIYSPILNDNIFRANMTTGNFAIGNPAVGINKFHIGNNITGAGLRVEGPAASGGTAASFGGFGDISVDGQGSPGGRFIIKNNGFVGIGNNNPIRSLDVKGNGNVFRMTGDDHTYMELYRSGLAGGRSGWIGYGTPGVDIMSISQEKNAALTFSTSAIERMRINQNGNIGIGIQNPSNQLVVFEDLFGGQMSLQSTSSGTSATDGFMIGHGAGNIAYVYNYENTNIVFGTNGINRMLLTSNGNLEFIGTNRILNEAFASCVLQNFWTNIGGNFATAQYYKDKEGRVHLKGTITGGLTSNGTLLFTLPVGYRPLGGEFQIFNVRNGFGSTAGLLVNGSTGEVTIYSSGATNNFLCLDGISFRAE